MINNGKGTCECLFNCSSEKNPVGELNEKGFSRKVCTLRYVDPMESCMEMSANWNRIVVFRTTIFNRLIMHTVNSFRIFI